MKVTKHQANPDGLISIQNCIRLLTMGLQKNVVTLWAVTDPLYKKGVLLRFHVKEDGSAVTIADCQRYITSFISNEGVGVWHLFGEEPKVVPGGAPLADPNAGPAQDPSGRILT